MIDTHAHLYLPEFKDDFPSVMLRAEAAGVDECWIPGIDFASLDAMEPLRSAGTFHFFAGLHPCEVKDDFRKELKKIRQRLDTGNYSGIGEIGLDLYWDKTFYLEQCEALTQQFEWALERKQPVLIHVRDAFDAIMPLVRPFYSRGLRGIFHSFSGTHEQALELTEAGFLLGINGVVTFKNCAIPSWLAQIPLSCLVTETDAPYLAPVPHRGKRNEPAYIPLVVEKLASIYEIPASEIAVQTTSNARRLLTPNAE